MLRTPNIPNKAEGLAGVYDLNGLQLLVLLRLFLWEQHDSPLEHSLLQGAIAVVAGAAGMMAQEQCSLPKFIAPQNAAHTGRHQQNR